MRLPLRLSVVLAIGLCSLSLIAQDDSAPPPQQPSPPVRPAPRPPAPTGSIHGTVICGDTHKPARGALVMAQEIPSSNKEARNDNPGITRTAMDGSYTLNNIAEGEYGVAAFLPGYLSPLDNLAGDDLEGEQGDAALAKRFAEAGTVSVTAHQTSSRDITLTRGATVSGQVLFSDGSPASQINIQVEDISIKPRASKPGEPDLDLAAMFKTMFTHQTNATDDEGRFRISGLAPGTYRIAAVSVSTMGMENDSVDGMALFAGLTTDPTALHVYSGDTLHKRDAKTYDLRPGDNITGIDITIPLNAFHQVHGLLAAKDGRPVNNATLILTDSGDDSVHFSTRAAPDGTFTFPNVPSGTYKLSTMGAHIVEADADGAPQMFRHGVPMHPIAAFADAETSLIVKDSDVLDVSLPLTEVPLPKDANPNATPAPPQD